MVFGIGKREELTFLLALSSALKNTQKPLVFLCMQAKAFKYKLDNIKLNTVYFLLTYSNKKSIALYS